jgi:Tol biopolymer transport system component
MARGDAVPVTQSSDLVQHPNVSPDGEWLAYVSQGYREDLYIMRADGTGRRQLTDDVYIDRFPKWSPDGKTIAFYSSRSGRNEIWSIHPDGSGLRRLTEIESGFPSWSPDGRRIAASNLEQGTFIFNPALPWKDQTVERLPPMDDVEVFRSFSWSPDGKRLAGFLRPYGGIAVFSLATRQYRKLTDFGRSPVWLRDSRRLLFYDSSWDHRGIHLVDIETKETHEIFSLRPDRTAVVTLSPDERWIYFERFGLEANIWLLDLPEER